MNINSIFPAKTVPSHVSMLEAFEGIENDSEEAEQDLTRYITVSKNKLSGWHGTIVCNIKPEVSRYVD